MSNGDKSHSPLSDVLSMQVGDAVLGYHIMYIAPGQCDSCPSLRKGTILETLPLLGGPFMPLIFSIPFLFSIPFIPGICAGDQGGGGQSEDGLSPGAIAVPRMKSAWPPMPL